MKPELKSFVSKAGAWAAAALVVYTATEVLLGGQLPYLVPGILAAGAIYFALIDRTRIEGGAFLKRGIGLLFAAFAVWLAVPQAEGSGIEWQPYAPDLVDAARKGNRPVIIDFTATWCGPCREMERNVFSRRKVVEAAAPFLALRADLTETTEENQKLALRFKIEAFPTIVFLGPDGAERVNQRLVGYERAESFVQRLQAAR